MSEFKQCPKGHFYKEELGACPYCPSSTPKQPSSNDKTQVFGGQTTAGPDPDKTVFGGAGLTPDYQGTGPVSQRDLSKTFIQGMDDGTSKDGPIAPRPTRKIMGWIISYTLDPMGMDYRIYEGNNTIGRDMANSIVILQDNAVSSKHVTILSRHERFYLRDEMSANGTFLNGEEIEISVARDLKDGDLIRLGKTTVFKFKTAQ